MKEIILIITALAIYDILKIVLLTIMETNHSKTKDNEKSHKRSKFHERLEEAINKKNK